jgi:hypothetical protein
MRTRSIRRARLLGAGLLVAVFGSGLMAGAAGERLHARRMLVTIETQPGLPDELTRLQLSPAQAEQITGILERGRPRTAALLRDLVPQLCAVLASIDTEVRAVLTPDQRAALDAARRQHPVFLLKQRTDTGAEQIENLTAPCEAGDRR